MGDKAAQAAAKEELAKKFDRWAGEVEGLLKEITTTPSGGREIWTGPAADRFNGTLKTQRNNLSDLGSACRTTAENLRREARELRESGK
ncbi:WXG100 family type VII secretion target [Nonomuraea soli]|uniref:Uncharacterized protein YukE n=1 Tax=Nonomuraea soli TaxID=1032476 RepID=A0A7W0HRC9_9ACTN|nr:hypothetical protein [Nonomuraea soli]MBA2892511.1 uncharacterized protein YukE [Nonomuraea soli]